MNKKEKVIYNQYDYFTTQNPNENRSKNLKRLKKEKSIKNKQK